MAVVAQGPDSCDRILTEFLGESWRRQERDPDIDSDSEVDCAPGNRREVECRLGPLVLALMNACRRKFDEVWRSLPSTDFIVVAGDDGAEEEHPTARGGWSALDEMVSDRGAVALEISAVNDWLAEGCSGMTSSSSLSAQPCTASEQTSDTSTSLQSLEQFWLTGMHAEYALSDGTVQPVTIGRLWSGGRSASIRYRCPNSGEHIHRIVKCSSLRMAEEEAGDTLAECSLDELYQGLAARGLVLEEPVERHASVEKAAEAEAARSRRFRQPTQKQQPPGNLLALARTLPSLSSSSGKGEKNQEGAGQENLGEPWKVGDEGEYYSSVHGQRWHRCEVAKVVTSQKGQISLALKVWITGGNDDGNADGSTSSSLPESAIKPVDTSNRRCCSMMVRLPSCDSRLRRPGQPSLQPCQQDTTSTKEDPGKNTNRDDDSKDSKDTLRAAHAAYRKIDGQAGSIQCLAPESQSQSQSQSVAACSWDFPLSCQERELRLLRSLTKNKVPPYCLAHLGTDVAAKRKMAMVDSAIQHSRGRSMRHRHVAEFPLSEVEKRARFVKENTGD